MVESSDTSQERTLHVGNVPSYVDENVLRQLFQGYGDIVTMRSGGKPNHMTRYWFVEFSTRREASSALVLNGTLLGDRELRISMAQTPRIGNTSGGGPSSRMIRNNNHGAVNNCVNMGNAVGPHNPAILPDQPLPIHLPGYPIMATLFMGAPPPMGPVRGFGTSNNNNARHSREKVNRTVFVEGIACDASVEDIARYFATCGVVVAVRVSDTCASSRRAWVEYETRDGAIAALDLSRPPGMDNSIVVRPSRTAICTNALSKPMSMEDDVDLNDLHGSFRRIDIGMQGRKRTREDQSPRKEPNRGSEEDKITDGESSLMLDMDENLLCDRDKSTGSTGARKKRNMADDSSAKSRKHRHSEQVSWWEKEGKYKR